MLACHTMFNGKSPHVFTPSSSSSSSPPPPSSYPSLHIHDLSNTSTRPSVDQKASTAVEACSKIYMCRVDLVLADAYKLLAAFGAKSTKQPTKGAKVTKDGDKVEMTDKEKSKVIHYLSLSLTLLLYLYISLSLFLSLSLSLSLNTFH